MRACCRGARSCPGPGRPVPVGWIAGAILAAAAGAAIARLPGTLRLDYVAIATLGTAEILIAVIRNEDWLVRGLKNVTGPPGILPRWPRSRRCPPRWRSRTVSASPPVEFSARSSGLASAAAFLAVLAAIVLLVERAMRRQWGRSLQPVKDDEHAAAALGIDAAARRRQVFVVGAAILGLAGAMLAGHESQLAPGSHTPLRFTFLVWVMMIVGGAGSSRAAAIGAMTVRLVRTGVEPAGRWLFERAAGLPGVPEALADRLAEGAPFLRMVVMGRSCSSC